MQTGQVYRCKVGHAVRIGRTAPTLTVDLAVNDPHVSRRHCILQATADGGLQVDDYSKSGTYVNDQRVNGRAHARPGESIRLAYDYVFQVMEEKPPPARRGQSLVGQTLAGRYQVQREVGRGGMGAVYAAQDTQLAAPCAVKVLHALDKEATARFRREAKVAAVLGEHPSIVRVYDHGTIDDKVPYLVMEFVDGGSLADEIARGLETRRGVQLLHKAALAVAYAHEQNILHRDLKPENVLVAGDDVLLTDFGIAKLASSKLTATGTAMGTPNYVAPEQITDSKRADPQADVYGLGGILYAILTSRPPYVGSKLSDTLVQVLKGNLVPPSVRVSGVDPALDALCCRALAKSPADRQQTAQELADALGAWLAGS